jgi:hypothetical protein
MPSRDEKGKRLSGAQQERHKLQAREVRRRSAPTGCEQPAAPSQGRDFHDLPPAPIGDPVSAIAWANDVIMVCMDKAMRDGQTPLEWKLNYLKDAAAKLGMIRDKAAEQKQIREILTKLDKKRLDAGMEPNKSGPVPHIPRPRD